MPNSLPQCSFSGDALQYLPILFLDADDTLFDTNGWIRNFVADNYPDKLAQFDSRPDLSIGGILGKDVEDKLLAEARFMEEANSYPGAKWLIQHLDRVGYPYAVCTHRGYHIDGYNHTVRALENLTGRYVPVYALNIGKGKHEFINQILRMSPYQQYLLVDDNVVPWSSEGNGVDAKHWASQICVDQSWNRTSHTGYARVVTLDSVVVALIDRIKQNTRHLDVGMACRAEIDHVLWQLDRLVKSDPAFPEPEERATGHFKMRAFAQFRLHPENAEKIAMQYQPHSPLACFWTP